MTYPSINFPRAEGHPRGDRPHSFAEAGGGVVICDRHDVGWWKRRDNRVSGSTISIGVAPDLPTVQRRAVEQAAQHVGAYFARRPDIVWV